jgi:hypothetical protein
MRIQLILERSDLIRNYIDMSIQDIDIAHFRSEVMSLCFRAEHIMFMEGPSIKVLKDKADGE